MSNAAWHKKDKPEWTVYSFLAPKAHVMVSYPHIYDSLAEFIAGMNPEKVLSFHAPQDIQTRLEELLDKKEEEGLGEEEEEELEHYFILEHIVRLAKSRARLLMVQGQSHE